MNARPDPVGGIRTGTWEGALVVGPWGDWRQGAFRLPPLTKRSRSALRNLPGSPLLRT